MNIIKFFYFVLLFLIFSCFVSHLSFAQTDTLALVNGEPIMSDEFITRFELTVYPGKGLNDNLAETKKKFLYSLVAEKLLSIQSQISSPDDINENYLKEEVKALFLRDALFRHEILSKIKITDADLDKGIRYSKYNYIVDTFYFPDSIWAINFYQKIDKKSNPYIYYTADSLNLCNDTLAIGYGESDETIENAFLDHDINYNSKPVNTIDGWIVFRIIDKKPDTRFSSVSSEENSMVHDIISYRKSFISGRDYILSVMKGIEVKVNYRIFNPLVYKIKSILSAHRPANFEGGYYLSRRELINLKDNFAFDPRAPLLKFGNGELSLGYIFDNLSLAGFAPIDTSVREITFSLHKAMKFIVQNYFLTKKAEEMGLENVPEVIYNTRTFLNAYRSFKFVNGIMDTVGITDFELNKFYKSHQDEVLRDIRLRLQIFSLDNMDEAAEILNKLNKQKQMPDTTGAVWLKASQLGEIGAVLSGFDNGTIYGPLVMNGKYTIFKILEKESDVTQNEIENSIQAAKDLLLRRKRNELLNKYLAELSTEQNVKIFESRLEKVDVTPIQMMTFRYIGFGGKIMAAPALYPRENWVKYLDDKKDVLP